MTHICVGKLTIIGSDDGLSPGRRQAIIWTNAGILLIGHLGTNFSEILIEIHTFSFKKIDFNMSAKWRPFCPGLNVLNPSHNKAAQNTKSLRTCIHDSRPGPSSWLKCSSILKNSWGMDNSPGSHCWGYYFLIHTMDSRCIAVRQTSNISRTKYQNLNVSRFVLQLSLPNPLMPGVKLRVKI